MTFAYFARSEKEEPIPFKKSWNNWLIVQDVLAGWQKPQDLAGILQQLKECDLTGKTIVSRQVKASPGLKGTWERSSLSCASCPTWPWPTACR